MLLRLLIASLLVAAVGCASERSGTSLEETTWRLVAAEGRDVGAEPREHGLWFGPDQTVRVVSCNGCQGLYAVAADTLSFQLGCTRMACPGLDLGAALGGVPVPFTREGDRLVLRTPGDSLTFSRFDG